MARFSLIIFLLLILAGCGSSERRKADEKCFYLGNGASPQYLDPHLVTGIPESNILRSVFEGLVTLDRDNNPAPGAAASWEILEEGTLYRFHLQPKGRWSNGDPVTAEDFVVSWKRCLSPRMGGKFAYMLHCIENAKAWQRGEIEDFAQVGLRAVDAKTLEVRLRAPLPYFLYFTTMTPFFPVHAESVRQFGDLDQRDTPWTRAGNLVGNGPFILEEWKPDQHIRVVPNPHYWDKASIHLEAVHFLPIDNMQTEERMFRRGRLHKTATLSPSRIAEYQEMEDSPLHIDPYLGTYYYKINTTQPPLDDSRVRLALAMTIDRHSIVEHITQSGQKPAPSFVPPNTAGYTSRHGIPYDPEEARKLLEQAGYPGGEGLPALELLYNTAETHRSIAEAIQLMWKKELGIKVELVNQDWKVYLDRLNNLDYAIARAGWIGDYPDPTTFLDCFLSDSGNNRTGFAHEEYDQLLEEAMKTVDRSQRLDIYQQAEKFLLDQAPLMPIYYYTQTYLLSPKVRGWRSNPLGILNWKGVDLETP